MADFDFDELDRAVSGALGDELVGSTQPEVFTDELTTVENPVKEKPVETTSEQSKGVAQANAAPAARRSSGRFMDVVHPSSDMRSGAGMPNRTTPVVVPAASQASATSAWPSAEPQKPETQTNDSSVSDELIDDWQKPLESPFLPDTKVEKRPLGGEAPTAADFDALELIEAPDDPRIEAHAMPDPIDFAESNSVPASHEEKPVLVEDTAGYGEGSFQPEVQTEVAHVQDVAEEVVPAGPASISPQYTAQPSSSPQPSAMYETEAYQKPVSVAPKKKSGAWVILWIILILLLGAGAGAAFYFYVLPML